MCRHGARGVQRSPPNLPAGSTTLNVRWKVEQAAARLDVHGARGALSRPEPARRRGAQGADRAEAPGGGAALVHAASHPRADRPAARRAAGTPRHQARRGWERASVARRRRQAVRDPGAPRPAGGAPVGARRAGVGAMYCPECGFQNSEAANYCSKCGALIVPEQPGAQTTMSFAPAEFDAETGAATLEELATDAPSLVIRAGGGRAGEHFPVVGEATSIGRSAGADILLDDVTVSRDHAVVRRRPDGLYIEDAGSLNGTYVNRHRVESHRLADGDELQIGKFKLTFLDR